MTKKKKYKSEVCTAYHEAGHAVMSYLLRRRFRYVTIDKKDLSEDQRGFLSSVLVPVSLSKPNMEITFLKLNDKSR